MLICSLNPKFGLFGLFERILLGISFSNKAGGTCSDFFGGGAQHLAARPEYTSWVQKTFGTRSLRPLVPINGATSV